MGGEGRVGRGVPLISQQQQMQTAFRTKNSVPSRFLLSWYQFGNSNVNIQVSQEIIELVLRLLSEFLRISKNLEMPCRTTDDLEQEAEPCNLGRMRLSSIKRNTRSAVESPRNTKASRRMSMKRGSKTIDGLHQTAGANTAAGLCVFETAPKTCCRPTACY